MQAVIQPSSQCWTPQLIPFPAEVALARPRADLSASVQTGSCTGGALPNFMFSNVALSASWPLCWIHKHSSHGLFTAIYAKYLICVHLMFPLQSLSAYRETSSATVAQISGHLRAEVALPPCWGTHSPPHWSAKIYWLHRECKGWPGIFG